MRFLMILFLLFLNLQANIIEAKYHVSYGIFGEIGVVKTRLKTHDKSYIISIEANTTGFARSLSGQRDEFFQSKGSIENGVLKPKIYTHTVTRMKRKNSFIMNPSQWESALSKKVKTMKFFDNFVLEERQKFFDGKLTSKSSKRLKYYAQNDLLSVFFNFKKLSNDYNITKLTKFYAVGAKNENGELLVLPMSQDRQREIFENVSGHNFIVFVNQPIFSSEKGELFVKINKDDIADEAILKDVLFFGDIRAKLVWKNIVK
ncbi:MAG: hypothetical protein CR967_05060 [Proteobacteria bacterium]|nr:MAG: hypothetical protein CR967_05060 [Pseudomonadota bacterium]